MGDGFHLALVQGEGGFQQLLAVAGGAGPGDGRPFGHARAQLPQGLPGGLNGAARVAGIEGIEQLALPADERGLGGGGARVQPQIAGPLVGSQVAPLHPGHAVAAAEGCVIVMAGEQRGQRFQPLGQLHAAAQPVQQLVQGEILAHAGFHGRAPGGEQVAVFRQDGGFLRQAQGTDEGCAQLRQEVQRPAQKGHMPANGLAAGQAGDGLVHHRLENGRGQILPGRAFVDQRLNVALSKHAAPGGNGVDFLVAGGQVVQPGGVGFQQGGHLVDEGARAAGADAVHALLHAAAEIKDFRVLAAQLDGHVRLGSLRLEGGGHRHHLLHEGRPQRVGQGQRAGARHAQAQVAAAQLSAHILQ